jgi:hypothetical protein
VNKKDGILLCTKCKCNVKLIDNKEGLKTYALPNHSSKADEMQLEKNEQAIEKALDLLKLRDRKNVERKITTGDVKYDHKIKKFVYVSDEEKLLKQRNKDGDDIEEEDEEDEDDDEDEDDSDEPEEKPKKKTKKQTKEEAEDSWGDEDSDSGEEVIEEKKEEVKEAKDTKENSETVNETIEESKESKMPERKPEGSKRQTRPKENAKMRRLMMRNAGHMQGKEKRVD